MGILAKTSFLVAPVAVGLTITLATDPILHLSPGLGFYSILWGVVGGLSMLGLLASLWRRRLGVFILAAILGVVGLVSAWWIAAWGVPPATLEGAWLWLLAGSTILLSLRLALAGRRS